MARDPVGTGMSNHPIDAWTANHRIIPAEADSGITRSGCMYVISILETSLYFQHKTVASASNNVSLPIQISFFCLPRVKHTCRASEVCVVVSCDDGRNTLTWALLP
jgi:hypothetical protein